MCQLLRVLGPQADRRRYGWPLHLLRCLLRIFLLRIFLQGRTYPTLVA